MKTLLKTLPLGLFAILALFIVSCNNDDDNNGGVTPEPPIADLSIYETAVSSPDLTILVEALERTGLDDVLNADGTYTVFAPTDDAFTAAGISLDDFTDAELTNLLLNHVLGTEVMSTDLTTTYVNTLATGPGENAISLFVNTDGGVTFNGVASPVADGLDIGASNGIIHLIDAPLGIPNVVEHAVANPNFSTLVSVVTALGESLPDLTAEGPYTIFAPTNEAFDALFELLGTTDIAPEVLEAVVLYHVVAGANVQSGDLSDGQEIPMGIDGEILTVDLSDGAMLMDGTGRDINIIATDVQGSNGVIHAVDQVLLPPTIVEALLANASVYQLAKLAPGYGTLAKAIERAGLVDALSDPEADLTVFAPDDTAFDTFLGGLTIDDVDADALANIILNHALAGTFDAAAVLDAGTRYTTSLATYDVDENISMYFNTSNGVVINGGADNGGATVVATDIPVVNGIVHAVDAVIGLPTIVTFAAADPNFSSLVGALTAEGQPDFVGILSGTDGAPFTVFAPINSAFEALESVPSGDALTAVLQHHVVGGANVRSGDLVEGPNEVPSLEGDMITVSLPSTMGEIADITDGSGNMGSIIAVDVQASNGVIHAIDKVLIPDTNN
ncbi:fasciclin domain-containing protein [Robertkochia sediminum]|uniref:fasciclin domain-containing protein n=1 Tax=Robertkochia sediminum TaxID=2785326 RepID=UPI0019339F90|nr:fasciclin domain-containing protein [Robertkochia sediminum]MBL7472682.1 fasciclin domain-containing protein [Robertkochia sediminum]